MVIGYRRVWAAILRISGLLPVLGAAGLATLA